MRACVLCCCLLLATVLRAVPLSGVVLGPDEKPLAGVTVSITSFAKEPERLTAVTDAAGAFTVEVKPFTSASDFLAQVWLSAPGMSPWSAMVKKGEKQTIHLTSAVTVHGKVVDAQGKPVAVLPVRITGLQRIVQSDLRMISIPETQRDAFTANTDAEGRWTLAGAPRDGTAVFQVEDPRFAKAEFYVAGKDAATEVLTTLRPAAVITGKVLTKDGAPAAGLRVRVRGDGADAQAVTGADGAYRLDSLPAGTFTLVLDEPAEKYLAVAVENVATQEGQVSAAPDLRLIDGAIIEGTITDEQTGAPIPNIYLINSGPHRPRATGMAQSVRTDDKGAYRLHVAPGNNIVGMFAGQGAEAYITAGDVQLEPKAGETKTQSFKLKKGLALAGQVVDTDGKPVAGIYMYLQFAGSNTRPYVRPDAQGKFTCNALPEGVARFVIPDYTNLDPTRDYTLVSPTEVRVPAAEPVTVIVRRTPYRTLTGSVATPNGQPVAGVKLTLRVTTRRDNGSSTGYPPVTTDDRGRFSLPHLGAKVEVSLGFVEKERYRYLSGGQVTAQENALAITPVVIAPCTGSISGQVLGADGKPVTGTKVMAIEGGASTLTTADADGKFTLSKLPEGELTVMAAAGTATVSQRAKTGSGPLTLRLPAAKPLPAPDIARATALLDEISQQSPENAPYVRLSLAKALALGDPDKAVELLQGGGQLPNEYHLGAMIAALAKSAHPHALEAAQQLYEQFTRADAKFDALVELSLALVDKEPDVATELYSAAREQITQPASQYAILALLAKKLKNNEAEALLEEAIDTAKGQGSVANIATLIAPVSLQRAFEVVKDVKESPNTYLSLRAQLIIDGAPADPVAARRMLVTLEGGMEMTAQRSYDLAAFAVVKALAVADPAGAQEVARTLKDPALRANALAQAACGQPKATAAAAFREAATATDAMSVTSEAALLLSFLADAARTTLQEVSGELFAQARTKAQAGESQWGGMDAYAFFRSRTDPTEARLLLEAELWQRTHLPGMVDQASYPAALARAMAPVDIDRAEEIARTLPQTNDNYVRLDTLRKLAEFILAPDAHRLPKTLDNPLPDHSVHPGGTIDW